MSNKLNVRQYKKSGNRFMQSTYARFIIPAGLIAYGTLAKYNHTLRNLDQEINEEVIENIPKRTDVDDYLRYLPSVAVYGVHFIGVKAKK